jgi:hypothetical protein
MELLALRESAFLVIAAKFSLMSSSGLSFSASLAGLLWKQILAQKGILVGRIEFAKHNAVPVTVCMIIGTLVIAGEVCIMYKS